MLNSLCSDSLKFLIERFNIVRLSAAYCIYFFANEVLIFLRKGDAYTSKLICTFIDDNVIVDNHFTVSC